MAGDVSPVAMFLFRMLLLKDLLSWPNRSGRDCCVSYDPISHEMHVVQQFNIILGEIYT